MRRSKPSWDKKPQSPCPEVIRPWEGAFPNTGVKPYREGSYEIANSLEILFFRPLAEGGPYRIPHGLGPWMHEGFMPPPHYLPLDDFAAMIHLKNLPPLLLGLSLFLVSCGTGVNPDLPTQKVPAPGQGSGKGGKTRSGPSNGGTTIGGSPIVTPGPGRVRRRFRYPVTSGPGQIRPVPYNGKAFVF